MNAGGKRLLTAGLATALVLFVGSQARGQAAGFALFGGQGAAFQMNPALGQAAYNTPIGNQFIAQGQGAYGYPGVPGYLGGGRISSTIASGAYGYGAGVSGNYSPSYSPPYGSTPYYPPYGYGGDPLTGAANLTAAYGQYAQDYQKARLLNQEVERSKIKTRRMIEEELRAIEASRPKADDVRRYNLEQDLTRARKLASITDILSAKSLNDLLTPVKAAISKGQRGPALPLDQDLMPHINVTPNKAVNIGLVRTGKLSWPLVFREKEVFSKARLKLDENLTDAIQRVRSNGKVDLALLRDLDAAYNELDNLVDREVVGMTTSQYIEAKHYLDLLKSGLDALKHENVANFFNRTYEARGKTAADLFEYMTKNGLVFAPATPGDEAAYRSMYSILAAYDEALTQPGSRN
jgi:hypothetical protein